MGPGLRRDDAESDAPSGFTSTHTFSTHTFAFPRHHAPGFCKIFRPLRAWGMPGARAPAAARGVVNTRVSHHGYAETPGIPARSGFNDLLRALPGDRALLSPSSANLTPASRRQDHTTSPSAISAFVKCAVNVHRISSRVRDDRDTPLMWDETQ
jgi:hypothetical protein